MSGSRGSAGAGVYRAREASLQPSTNRSWLSGVSSQPQKGLQQAAEVKHSPTVSGVACRTPRDVPSIPKSRCKTNASLSAETSSWGPSEENQAGVWLCPWPQPSIRLWGHGGTGSCWRSSQPCPQAWLLDLPWGCGLPAPCSDQPGSFGGTCALTWAKQGFGWFRLPGGPILSCCGR